MKVGIADKVALVTGANRGIGKAIVESMLAHGAKKVYLAVRNLDSVADLVAEYGDRVVPAKVDMAEPATIYGLAEQARDVQILINNAGILEVADPLADHAAKALQKELQVNVFGLITIAQAFAPILAGNGGGALVQLNSVASLKNFPSFTTYSASKAASYSLTQGLADSLGKLGIHVLSVHPGPIATDMADNAGIGAGAEPPSVVAEGVVSALEAGDFHLFPDSFAKQVGSAYRSFAELFIEADLNQS